MLMMTQAPTSFDWLGEAVDGVFAGTYPILGHGLWGPTLDLGDGTLLKLVRRHAGIGDGINILANEAHILSLLDGGRLDELAIPRLIAHGRFPAHSHSAADGYAAWLRMTRVAGRAISEDWLAARSATERERFADGFGTAAASLRRVATERAHRQRSRLDDRLSALLKGLSSAGTKADDCQLASGLLGAVEAVPEERRGGFVHGDLHLENMLVDDAGHVCSIIDFGEAGHGFPEIDLVYLHWLPSIELGALRAYQAAAGPIDQRAYHLAGAIYALTAAVLAERMGDVDDAAAERRRLTACLKTMSLERSA